MKRVWMPVLALALAAILSACGCSHDNWTEASCSAPRTCARCGETEGQPLPHRWQEMDCVNPQTCLRCGVTEGEPGGHAWVIGGCEQIPECIICGTAAAQAPGHSWTEDDGGTEVCTACGAVRGTEDQTDPRFDADACRHLFGVWEGELNVPGEALGEGMGEYLEQFACVYRLEFGSDGVMTMSVKPGDEELLREAVLRQSVELMYAEFAADGLSREDSNAVMEEACGMTVEEYAAEQIKEMDISEMFRSMTVSLVYYVEGDLIYLGTDWSSELSPDTYTLVDGRLYLPIEGREDAVFTRTGE